MTWLLVAGCMVITLPTAFGQASGSPVAAAAASERQTGKPLQFDIVSIKPDDGSSHATLRIMGQADGLSITATLKMLLGFAYGIREDLISGVPGWAADARYEVAAKVGGPDVAAYQKLSKEQRDLMVQAVLVERFKLKAHIETKELPVYELVVAKGGPRLQAAKPDDAYPNAIKGPDGVAHAGGITMRPGQIQGQAMAVSALVDVLSRELSRTIVDKTGLTGRYDVKLKYTPDNGSAPMLNGEPDTSAPSIFTALEEQLGLKLNSAKGPVDTLVVDHIEAPSEN
jgi:uncharacterized protein (TIGR03435 family)